MKSLSEFSILGGPPTFSTNLVVGMPSMPNREALHRRMDEMLDSRQLTNGGQFVHAFESELQRRIGCRHVVCVCNGTMALQILAKACDVSGEVIVPAMTFVATPHALQWIGLTPVFADIEAETQTLNPVSVEKCISNHTSAIMGVHLWGNPCQVADLQELADRHRLKLLFDASHAYGCSHQGIPIGRFGDAEAISFHATKVMHSIEGGAILTDDDTIAERCRLMRNFGISGFTSISSAGINAKMSELAAAVGLTSLENVDEVIRGNRDRLEEYRAVIDSVPGLHLAIHRSDKQQNAQYVVVKVNEELLGLNRDSLMQVLRAEGVFVRSYFSPGCHNAEPYRNNSTSLRTPLPVTDQLLQEVMQLPTGPGVTGTDVTKIGLLLQSIYQHRSSLRDLISKINHSKANPNNAAEISSAA